uniref:SFRICE_016663 n=1 Tax=Spodoptera frugiperda TaxID=7108 RepID=A0A2H1VN42_SPOFR
MNDSDEANCDALSLNVQLVLINQKDNLKFQEDKCNTVKTMSNMSHLSLCESFTRYLAATSLIKSLTANRKLLKAIPPLTSVTGEHHGVQCVKEFTVLVILLERGHNKHSLPNNT